MIVGDLLSLEDLRIEAAWATPELLARDVTGVTSTDLQDPARYLRRGELVLTGLVWWRPDDLAADPSAATRAASRFATALRSAEVAALLAGEGTHGTVPAELADACRLHDIPLFSVPAGTSFRAVTDRVYLRLWGELQRRSEGTAAVPGAVRGELLGLLHADATPSVLLTRAVADLGLPHCSLVTASGRLLGSSDPSLAAGPLRTAARPLPVGRQGSSPFDGWLLQPHAEPAPHAVSVLHGLAELLAPLATRARATAAAQRQSAEAALELIHRSSGRADELAKALAACGLPSDTPLTPVVARIDNTLSAPAAPSASWAATALAEALHGTGMPFAVAAGVRADTQEAVGLCAAPEAAVAEALREAWPRLQATLAGPQSPALVRAGVGPSTRPTAPALRAALVQAAYALKAAEPEGSAGSVGRSGELDSLAALVRGIPVEVQTAFRSRLLGPLAEHDEVSPVPLTNTLAVFLQLDASWARTARALHIHVNTVHYRIQRIEELTGRSLSRLEDRLDLRTALLCAPRAQSAAHTAETG
ncbi:hypothetical protein ABIA32_002364 [Streptacidiphilus sp. MAP12-20]|uniref:helix-turn-helix domain-containing protein n=1 Tax=Streptacidiphilus sp. MAP12-20 TaxID=3156299 RepID=UPI003511FE4E